MPIEFACEECETGLRVRDINAGRKTRCPRCGAINQIPGERVIPSRAEMRRRKAARKRRRLAAEGGVGGETSSPAQDRAARRSSKPKPQRKRVPHSAKTKRSTSSSAPKTAPKKSASGGKKQKSGGGVPMWLPLVGGAVLGLAIMGGMAAFVLPKLLAPGNAVAQQQAPQFQQEKVTDGKLEMSWEMPTGWKATSAVEDGIFPWAHLKGAGMEIRITPNKSLTEFSSTATSMGGAGEAVATAHLVRLPKLRDENMEYDETPIEKIDGGLICTSNFSYKGLFGKVHGVRTTIMGPSRPYTVRIECSQASLPKWKAIVLHVAKSIQFKVLLDDEAGVLAPGLD